MKKITFISVIAFIVLIITSCTSSIVSSKNNLIINDFPCFEGDITPILAPIKPEYKPASLIVNSSRIKVVEVFKNNKLKGKITSESSESYVISVSRYGDLLKWDGKLTRIRENNKIYEPDFPIMVFNMLSDKLGKPKEVNVTLPAYDKEKNDLKMDSEEYDKLIKTAENGVKSMFRGLPSNPVKTGDVWFELPTGEVFKLLGLMMDPSIYWVGKVKIRNLKAIIKGWSNLNDRKVIVVDANDHVSVTNPNTKDRVDISINGYTVQDSENFQTLNAEMVMTFEYIKSSSEKLRGKSYLTMKSIKK